MSKLLVVGNWKANGHKSMVSELLNNLVSGFSNTYADNVECLVLPPSVYLAQTEKALKDTSLGWGVQNVCGETSGYGAYTGEITAQMATDFGCGYALIGHSERRKYYSETNDMAASKIQQCVKLGIVPILCVGEPLDVRENKQTIQFISEQIKHTLTQCKLDEWSSSLVIAYEPVWSIGTGKTPLLEEIEEVHNAINSIVYDLFSDSKTDGSDIVSGVNDISKKSHVGQSVSYLRVIYGGSVGSGNARKILGQKHVDGVLVGGAALSSDDFFTILDGALG